MRLIDQLFGQCHQMYALLMNLKTVEWLKTNRNSDRFTCKRRNKLPTNKTMHNVNRITALMR